MDMASLGKSVFMLPALLVHKLLPFSCTLSELLLCLVGLFLGWTIGSVTTRSEINHQSSRWTHLWHAGRFRHKVNMETDWVTGWEVTVSGSHKFSKYDEVFGDTIIWAKGCEGFIFLREWVPRTETEGANGGGVWWWWCINHYTQAWMHRRLLLRN